MNVKHLDHLNLTVGSFDGSADWYRRVFGFEVVQDEVTDEGVRWGVLRSGDAMLCIYEHPDKKSPRAYEDDRHTIRHFALRITDREAWERTLEREKIECGYGGGAVAWPHSTAWYVSDPNGYEIEVALWDDDTVRFG